MIRKIYVEQLFGKYTYHIEARDPKSSNVAPQLMLLYGGNGSGKTTILKILWNLFSPSPRNDHRSNLIKTPFRRVVVTLGNGEEVQATKTEGLVGPLTVSVRRGEEELLEVEYPSRPRDVPIEVYRRIRNEYARQGVDLNDIPPRELGSYVTLDDSGNSDPYIEYLESMGYVPVLLADDRKMHLDSSESRSSKNRYIRYGDNESFEEEKEESQLAVHVETAVRRAYNWLRQAVLAASEAGSESVEDVYLQVLSRLSNTGDSGSNTTLDELRKRIIQLEERARQFTEFGIFPGFDSQPYSKLLRGVNSTRADAVISVLEPYVSSQDARLDQLQPLQEILRSFVVSVNQYLVDKEIRFTLQGGLVISGATGRLRPNQLSSGERQLLLLVCNALLARNNTGLFLVDEPELSLNAGWQRKIVGTLLDLAQGSNVQFVMATHSIEIITRHRRSLAPLGGDDE
ncbi:ATP-binding protein [Amycolatopsis acidiphila]|nr:ATP-binding protein [Amycolatopsis acidiphila]